MIERRPASELALFEVLAEIALRRFPRSATETER